MQRNSAAVAHAACVRACMAACAFGVRAETHIVSEELVQRLEVGESEIGERAASLLGHLHRAAGDVVCLSERHALHDRAHG
jgi:hypothetical protein